MNAEDVAEEIYSELGEPADISIASIEYWVISNIGKLNSVIFTNFNKPANQLEEITGTFLGKECTLEQEESAILKKIYMAYFYQKKITETISVSATDTLVELTSDDGKVKRTDRSQMLRSLNEFKKIFNDELNDLIRLYKVNKGLPNQVVGDDIYPETFSSSKDYNRQFEL